MFYVGVGDRTQVLTFYSLLLPMKPSPQPSSMHFKHTAVLFSQEWIRGMPTVSGGLPVAY